MHTTKKKVYTSISTFSVAIMHCNARISIIDICILSEVHLFKLSHIKTLSTIYSSATCCLVYNKD